AGGLVADGGPLPAPARGGPARPRVAGGHGPRARARAVAFHRGHAALLGLDLRARARRPALARAGDAAGRPVPDGGLGVTAVDRARALSRAAGRARPRTRRRPPPPRRRRARAERRTRPARSARAAAPPAAA